MSSQRANSKEKGFKPRDHIVRTSPSPSITVQQLYETDKSLVQVLDNGSNYRRDKSIEQDTSHVSALYANSQGPVVSFNTDINNLESAVIQKKSPSPRKAREASVSPQRNVQQQDKVVKTIVRYADYEENKDKGNFRTFPVPPVPKDGYQSSDSEDQEKEREIKRARKKQKKPFNPGGYVFKKTDYNTKQDMFKQQFYENRKANRTKINHMLVEQTYLQINHRFDKEKKNGNFLGEFKQNQMKWSAQLMRSKRLQKVMADYTDRLATVLESELQETKLVQDWVQYPHSHSVSPSSRNHLKISGLQDPIWYPEHPPIPKAVQSVFDRQKQHLKELAEENRRKKEGQVEAEVKEQEDVEAKKSITQQVLDRMRKESGKDKDANKIPTMTPFQEAIHERLQIAKEKINSIIDIDDVFRDELEECELELIKSKNKKQGKNPGVALRAMLAKWSEEPHGTQKEFNQYKSELWMSLQQFEKYLNQQEFAMEIELKNSKQQYKTRVDGIRNQTSFQIEALESALIETKLRLNRERERADMQLCEMESTMFNQQLRNQEVEKQVQEFEDKFKTDTFDRMDDSRKVHLLTISFKRMSTSVKTLLHEKNGLIKEINEYKHTAAQNDKFNKEIQKGQRSSKEMILYYQQTLYEMLEHTGMLSDLGEGSMLSEKKQLELKEVFELNAERLRLDAEQDRTYRQPDEKKKLARLSKFVDEFHTAIVSVDFRSLFELYQKIVDKKEKHIDTMTAEFVKMGILDGDDPSLKKIKDMIDKEAAEENPEGGPPGQANMSQAQQAAAARIAQNQANTAARGAKGVSKSPLKKGAKGKSVEEPKHDMFQMHSFRMDNAKLNEIRNQFKDLVKPVTEGIADVIQQQEEIETMESVHEIDSRPESQQSGAGKFGLDQHGVGAKGRMNPEEAAAYQAALMQKQEKRANEKEMRDIKAAAVTKRKELAASRAEQRKLGTYRGGSSRNVMPSRTNNTSSKMNSNSRTGSQMHQKGSEFTLAQKSLLKLHKTGSNTSDMSLQSMNMSEVSQAKRNLQTDPSKAISKFGNQTKQQQSAVVKKQKILRDNIIDKSSRDITRQNSERKTSAKATKRAKKSPSPDLLLEEDARSDVMTEPIDPAQEFMKELENKVLDKYQEELDEMEEYTEPSMWKLKAHQTKDLLRTFQETLGTQLLETEDTEMNMIGSLEDFVDKVNEMQDQYILAHVDKKKKGTGINVDTLDETMKEGEPVPEKKIKRQATIDDDDSEDENRNVPIQDCILTELSEDGELKGFKVRPEIIKLISYREDGKDQSQFQRVIKTVNYLNRIMFQPDIDFKLIAKGQQQVKRRDSEPEIETEIVEKVVYEEIVRPATPTAQYTEMLDMLKRHAAAVFAKGNSGKKNYQFNMFREDTIEELLKFPMSKVIEKRTVEDSEDDNSENAGDADSSKSRGGSITFQRYLQTLFSNLEIKLAGMMEKNPSAIDVAVQDLVLGEGFAANRKSKARATQTDKSKKKNTVKSKYMDGFNKKDQECQTDQSLLDEYLRDKSGISAQLATQQIDHAVWEETKKTIVTLNEFVSVAHREKKAFDESGKEVVSLEDSLFSPQEGFNRNGKSIATQGTSTAGPPQPQSSTNVGNAWAALPPTPAPKEQLSKIRQRLDQQKSIMEGSIEAMRKNFGTAQYGKREKPKKKAIKMSQGSNWMALSSQTPRATDNQQFPRLTETAATVQRVTHTRNQSQIETQRMPQLNPFKQVRVDRQSIYNADLTEHTQNQFKKRRPSSSHGNVPGLIAKKLDFTQRSNELVKQSDITIVDSIESQDFHINNLGNRTDSKSIYGTINVKNMPKQHQLDLQKQISVHSQHKKTMIFKTPSNDRSTIMSPFGPRSEHTMPKTLANTIRTNVMANQNFTSGGKIQLHNVKNKYNHPISSFINTPQSSMQNSSHGFAIQKVKHHQNDPMNSDSAIAPREKTSTAMNFVVPFQTRQMQQIAMSQELQSTKM